LVKFIFLPHCSIQHLFTLTFGKMKKKYISQENLFGSFKDDFRSGVVVFLVALPLCLGIALASGAPLFAGVISGIVGGIIVGYLSGSSLSVSGPAAGLTVIVMSGIERLDNQFSAFILAVVVAGVMQVILGFAKAGIISLFFPTAVIRGMLAAIGLTLILKQIPHALGDDRDAEGEFVFFQLDGQNTFTELINAIGDPSFGAVIVSLAAFAILLSWDKLTRPMKALQMVPSSLVAVVVATLINMLFMAYYPTLALRTIHLVSLPVINNLDELAALVIFPDFTQIANLQVYLTAATIAIVASLETLLNIEAMDKIDPFKRRTPANRELQAQGIGNIVAGLIGGIPITSVVVRSSVNIQAGARSKLSAIIHGVLLLISVLFLSRVMNLIPLAALASILILTGYKLTKLIIYKEMYQLGWPQFLPFVATIVAVLFTDLLIGIGIGMVIGLFFILRENSRTSHFMLRKSDTESDYFHIDLSEHVSFLNKAGIAEILQSLPENSTVDIDATQSAFIDYDVLEVIRDFEQTAKAKNITFNFMGKVLNKDTDKVNETPALPDQAEISYNANDSTYHQLIENNQKWVAEKLNLDPDYFHNMAKGQHPKFFFIGCSDSRVHPNEITDTQPGEMFIHRNVANMVVNTDLNFMSVLQYAVEVLKVEHIIVCGHYGCGGVKAAMQRDFHGLIDKWLRNIKDVYRLYKAELDAIKNEDDRFKRIVELNVTEQVYNLHKSSIVQKAWNADANVRVHGWVYDIKTGYVKDLNIRIEDIGNDYEDIYRLQFNPQQDYH